MAGWSPCGDPVPVHTFAPRNSRRHLGSREKAEPRIRRGGGGRGPSRRGRARRCWGQMAAVPATAPTGSSAPGERQGRREEDGAVRAAAAWAGGAPVPCAGEPERSGWVWAWTWRFHPLPGSNADTSDLSSCCQCTRWNRKEGGREGAQTSFVSVPRPPITRARCSPPRSGLWPCLVLFRALCVGGGEEGAGEAKCTKITGGKGRVNLYQAYSVSATYCCSCIVVIRLLRTTARPEHLL